MNEPGNVGSFRAEAVPVAERRHFTVLVNGDPKPLRPYCNACGWRKGGPDSWDGVACKCHFTEPPVEKVGP